MKLYRSSEGGGGRPLTDVGRRGSRSFVLLSVLVMMSVFLSASAEEKIHWYISEPEANRLGIQSK
jgi:hypothetical protein